MSYDTADTEPAEQAAGLSFEDALQEKDRWSGLAQDHAERLKRDWRRAGCPAAPDAERADTELRRAFLWALARPDARLHALLYRQAAARAETWAEVSHRLCPGHRWEVVNRSGDEAIRACQRCGAVTL